MKYSEDEYPLQKESYQIIGICMEVHRILGKGLLEIVYKDDKLFSNISMPFGVDNKLWRKLINNKKSYIIICESVANF